MEDLLKLSSVDEGDMYIIPKEIRSIKYFQTGGRANTYRIGLKAGYFFYVKEDQMEKLRKLGF